MIGINGVFELDGLCAVWEDGYGEKECSHIGAADWYDCHTYRDTGDPAYKIHGSHGDIYVRESDVSNIETFD